MHKIAIKNLYRLPIDENLARTDRMRANKRLPHWDSLQERGKQNFSRYKMRPAGLEPTTPRFFSQSEIF